MGLQSRMLGLRDRIVGLGLRVWNFNTDLGARVRTWDIERGLNCSSNFAGNEMDNNLLNAFANFSRNLAPLPATITLDYHSLVASFPRGVKETTYYWFTRCYRALATVCMLYQLLAAPLEFGFCTIFPFPSYPRHIGSGVAVFMTLHAGGLLYCMKRGFSYKFLSCIVWFGLDCVGLVGIFASKKHPWLYFCLLSRVLTIRHIMSYYKAAQTWIEEFGSLCVSMIYRIAVFTAIFMCCMHVVACLLLHIGTISTAGWVTHSYGQELKDGRFFFLYFMSYYFAAVTISTVGFGDLSPITLYEKLFCVVIVISTVIVSYARNLYNTARSADQDRDARAAQDDRYFQAFQEVLDAARVGRRRKRRAGC